MGEEDNGLDGIEGGEGASSNEGEAPESQEDNGATRPAETESVEETVRRSIEELSEKDKPKSDDEDEEDAGDKEEESGTKVESEEEEKPLAAKGQEEKPSKKSKGAIPPPNDWSAEGKQFFKKAPKEVQKEWKRVSDEFQKWRQPLVNQLNQQQAQLEQAYEEVQGVRQVVSRFLPRWGVQGLTPEQAISQMCSFNELCYQDQSKALHSLAASLGKKITIEGEKPGEQPKQQDPILLNLAKDVQDIKQERTRSQQYYTAQQRQAFADELDTALESLMEETVEDGSYKFPDLHSIEFQRTQVEPLVRAILEANPNKDPTAAIRQGYLAAGGRVIRTSSAKTTKLNGTSDAARRASASVPGGGSGSQSVELEYIPNESVEQTVRRAVAAHRTR